MADGALTLEIDEELADSVRAAAAAKGIPVDVYVRDALAHHLFAEVEWSEDSDPAVDYQIAEAAIRNETTIPFEDIAPWLRSWGKPDEPSPPKWRK